MTVFEVVGILTVAAALFILVLIKFEHSNVATSRLRRSEFVLVDDGAGLCRRGRV